MVVWLGNHNFVPSIQFLSAPVDKSSYLCALLVAVLLFLFQCEHQLSYSDGNLESVKWYKVNNMNLNNSKKTYYYLGDQWRPEMGEFLHLHARGGGEREEADSPQAGGHHCPGM